VTQHKRGLREKDRFLFLMDGDRKGRAYQAEGKA
jgi:hypothetical protein